MSGADFCDVVYVNQGRTTVLRVQASKPNDKCAARVDDYIDMLKGKLDDAFANLGHGWQAWDTGISPVDYNWARAQSFASAGHLNMIISNVTEACNAVVESTGADPSTLYIVELEEAVVQ